MKTAKVFIHDDPIASSVTRPSKRFLLFLGCFFLGMSGLIIAEWGSVYRSQRDGVLSEIRATESGRVAFQKHALAMALRLAAADTRILVDSLAMSPFLTGGEAASTHALEQELLAMSKAKGVYERIFVLDAAGKEAMRVDYNEGRPTVAPREKLKDRSQLPYFTEGFELDRGQVYMSRFDLVGNSGILELPRTLTIRFASPLFDASGKKVGLLVLKVMGRSIISRMDHSSLGRSDSMSMLINTEGYWLRSPNNVDEWGFAFANNRTFSARFPKASAIISNQVQGAYQGDEGMFFFQTVYPLAECRAALAPSVGPAPHPEDLTGRHWKVISFISRGTLEARLNAKWWTLVRGGGLLLLMIGLITLLLGAMRLRDQKYFMHVCQSKIQLADAHASLRMHAEETDRANAVLRREIVERRRAERALASSEEKFRVLYQSSAEAVMLLDEKGFFDCNDATLKLFGCGDSDEFYGKHPGDVSAQTQPNGGNSRQEAAKRISEAMLSGNSQFEWTFRRMDGTEFLANVVLHSLELEGRKVLQSVVRDISAGRQAKEELANTLDKLRRFNRLAVGRERRMVELKDEVDEMARKAGIAPPYAERFVSPMTDSTERT